MDKKMITGGVLAGLILMGGIVGTLRAQTGVMAPELTKTQAIEIAVAEVTGDVLEIALERENGIQAFDVEIMTADGVEMKVEINAKTGEVLEVASDGDHQGCGEDEHDDATDKT